MRLAAITTMLMLSASAFCLDITIEGGESLSMLLANADPDTRHLSISGTIPSDDLKAIRDFLPGLTSINLTDASIVPPVIPEYAFAGTPLSVFTPPATLSAIEEAAFAATQLTSFNAPESLSIIDRHAFAHCSKLREVTLGDNLIKLGDYALADCPMLAEVMFGRSLVTVGDCALQGSAATHLDLSRCTALDKIGSWAFSHSLALQTVSLPGHKHTLGDGMLAFCPELTGLTGLEGVEILPILFAAGDTSLQPDLGSMARLRSILDHSLHAIATPALIKLPATLSHLGRHAMEGMTGLTRIDARELSYVPTTDTDVWAGIDKSKITLLVADGLEDAFRQAPQWQEFRIKTPTSGIDNVTDDRATPLKIKVSHTRITATSADGISVMTLTTHLPDGRIASMATGPEISLSADLPQLAGKPVIITATDAAGRKTTLSTILTH